MSASLSFLMPMTPHHSDRLPRKAVRFSRRLRLRLPQQRIPKHCVELHDVLRRRGRRQHEKEDTGKCRDAANHSSAQGHGHSPFFAIERPSPHNKTAPYPGLLRRVLENKSRCASRRPRVRCDEDGFRTNEPRHPEVRAGRRSLRRRTRASKDARPALSPFEGRAHAATSGRRDR